MKILEIEIPNGCKPGSIGFVARIVAKACEATADDINIKTNDGLFVDLKSIMGVLTLNYHSADKFILQIMGETEDFTAMSLEKFIKNELANCNKN